MDHTRHSEIFIANHFHITMIGAGGIGSATGLGLGKMGVGSLAVFDFDQVDEENIATQIYRTSDVGNSKVKALKGMLQDFTDETDIHAIEHRVEADGELFGHVVISAVDSITARQAIWEAVKRGSCKYYLDARMSAETFQLFAVDPRNSKWYENLLQGLNEEDVPDDACTAKATIYTALFAGGRIGHAVKQVIKGEALPRIAIDDLNNYSYVQIW